MLALASCKSGQSGSEPRTGPESASLTEEFTATSEVVAVDREKRTLTLRREDGGLLVLKVGQVARNFDQIAVGDEVRARYKETLTVSLRPAGETARAAQGAIGAGRAEAGAKPGGGVGVAMNVRVKIESIDVPHDIVVFSLASGKLVAHRLATPEGRAFVEELRVGDVVQLDYVETLALSVEKV